jgi:HK97 family phage portal protein
MDLFKWFRRSERKESRTAGIVSTGYGGAAWTTNDYENFAKETYLKNVIAFRCIDEISKSVASVSWNLFNLINENKREVVLDHPINELLKRPNPSDSLSFIMLSMTAYLVMSGNSFIERIGPTSGDNAGIPKELHVLRPDRMKILTSNGKLDGFEYKVGSNCVTWKIDPITKQCDVLHMKSFHPTDDWWGAAVTEPTAREIDSSNQATEWNKAILDNEGRPGMVFTLVGAMGEESFDALERHLRDEHTGAKNAGKNIVITGESGTKAQPYAWSPKDLDFIEGGRELARRIALGYGVPPQLLGIPGDNTYSNYKEARMAFWETTVLFYLNYFRGELNNWIFLDEESIFLDYVLDDIPALSPKREALWERAQKSDFLTINEKRELVGLEKYEPEESPGDVILVPASMIPLGVVEDEEEDDDEGNEIEDEEEEEMRAALLRQGYSEDEIDEMVGIEHSEEDIDSLDTEYLEGEMPFEALPDEGKPFPNEHACRLQPPGSFEKFNRMNCFRKSADKCVDYIFGIKKGKASVQALRYRKNAWTSASARSHCESRGGTFEAAGKANIIEIKHN